MEGALRVRLRRGREGRGGRAEEGVYARSELGFGEITVRDARYDDTIAPPLLVRASGYAVGIRIGIWGFCCVEVWNIIDFVITAFDTMELQW